MALKLITRKDVLIENKEQGIAFRLGRLLPEHISEMSAMRYESQSPQDTIAIYAMRNCMSTLVVSGEPLEPVSASYQVETTDPETAAALSFITVMLIEEVLISEEVKKKLKQQRETSSQETVQKAASPAPSSEKGS